MNYFFLEITEIVVSVMYVDADSHLHMYTKF